MSCCFENTLHYSSPGHGDWGVVRIGMQLPESCQLFVCPSACGRHGAIGAMKQGFKNRLFYLYLSQSDIIDGYDDLIVDAVTEVLENLEQKPKTFYVFVSCLDDLIGTDHDALRERLQEEHPEIHFLTGHMNPISLDSETPPPVSVQKNLYSVLDAEMAKDKGINSVGNLVAVEKSSELYSFLKKYGVTSLRHISDYKTFSSYQEMAKSRANLVLGATAIKAAQDMEKRLGTPYLFLPVTYDLEEIEENYKKLQDFLFPEEQEEFDFSQDKRRAEAAIAQTQKEMGDMPIIIDATAVMQPFGLAKAMLEWGFHVVRVESQACAGFDRGHFEWLQEKHPEVEIYQTEHHNAVLFDRRKPESLAIGVEGAYLSGSKYVADLFNDNGMFGYDGVVRLMQLLVEAVKAPVDLEELINSYGLVV